MKTFDIAIIGGGPGGYEAAIRASSFGKKVALIESGHMGGTCLNTGCIPSKTLLRHSEILEDMKQAKDWGIETGDLKLDWSKMASRQNKVVRTLRSGVEGLMKKHKVTVLRGKGYLEPQNAPEGHTINVISDKEEEKIEAAKVIIATGSKPSLPPIEGLDDVDVHTSDSIFSIEELPSSIVIVGGGIIGVEFATIFSSLGVHVTIVELGERLIPTEDEEAASVIRDKLKKSGVDVRVNLSVASVAKEASGKSTRVLLSDESSLETDMLLVATGRHPNTEVIQNTSIDLQKGYIKTNGKLETSLPGVYAIGDVNGKIQLAHTASAEGLVAVNNASGKPVQTIDYHTVPKCVYTLPEIASVGLTEEEARSSYKDVKVSKIPYSSNGKALSSGNTEGFVKIVAEEQFGEILGVTMVGSHVTEMISESVAFMNLEGTVEELAQTVHPHPTLSEAMFEAANNWLNMGIHH
ncbi:dihydrolipoyl dehydrogenase [Salimicrobium halophilum]|uniref:Dihydrolipoyl dehydrogenase n=1 Tax=Salimicrobium halophilum TaxID=86666 RepID=A0A1G8URT6_9BACI|nr:dihydrolipoyl dehydrogenase [Salimicrobium halophilum]SDJ56501.1 dihydrolipoamide dehydrogenase [Salimicrobium halophilum]